MKNFIFLLFLSVLVSCETDKKGVDPDLREGELKGEWKAEEGGAGGFENPNSYKNYQVDFTVPANNLKVIVNLISSDINVSFVLYDLLGQPISNSGPARQHMKDFTLNAGTYRLAVSGERRAVGKFELYLDGINDALIRRPFQRISSETQNWGTLGSGGPLKSFKNGFYTFEVTEDNSFVDIEMESPDVQVGLYFYDALGSLTDQKMNDRYTFMVKSLKKGTYTIMAGTRERGQVGNYKVSITGKVQNIKKVESSTVTKTGRWNESMARDTYLVEILTANSPLDVELASPDTDIRLELQTEHGDFIETKYLNRSEFIVRSLAKGKYRIVTGPAVRSSSPGSYTLHVNGQIGSVTKL